MNRKCSRCGTLLNQYNPGKLCLACQRKGSEKLELGDRPYYDVEDMACLLGLDSTEQVRRLGRNNRLPPRIPAIRKWLWEREVVERWMKPDGQLPKGCVEQLAALADAHGGLHLDEASGRWKAGTPEVVSPIVCDRNGSKTAIYTEFIPEHSELP